MSNRPYEKLHTDELLRIAFDANTEIAARMKGVMFGLSYSEVHKDERELRGMLKLLLDQMRGEMPAGDQERK